MIQNIIAYSVILLVFASSGYFLRVAWVAYFDEQDHFKAFKNLVYSIIVLIVAGWISTVGQAYHIRTINEAQKDYYESIDKMELKYARCEVIG